jgi:hypothetical protein
VRSWAAGGGGGGGGGGGRGARAYLVVRLLARGVGCYLLFDRGLVLVVVVAEDARPRGRGRGFLGRHRAEL